MRNIYKNSIATTTLFLLLAIFPISCDLVCNNTCGCGSQTRINDFKIISFKMLTTNPNGEEISPNSTQPYEQVLKTFKIKDIEMVAAIPSTFFGIPGVVLACSPIPPKSQERLKEIKIFNTKEVTLGDGTVLKPGDLLNEFFQMNYYFASSNEPIEEFLSEERTIYLDDYFKLIFIKAPQKQVVIEFSMLFIFESGSEISISDEKLSIQ